MNYIYLLEEVKSDMNQSQLDQTRTMFHVYNFVSLNKTILSLKICYVGRVE